MIGNLPRRVLLTTSGLMFCSAIALAEPEPATFLNLTSPAGRVRVDLSLARAANDAGIPQYRVSFKDRPVVLDSALQVELADGTTLGSNTKIEGSEITTIDETYRQYPGKRSTVVNRCSQAVISFREAATVARRWQLVVRAYDDGAAFRYHFPQQEGWPGLVIASERTMFTFPTDASAFELPLNSFTTPYEKRYEHKAIAALPENWLLGLPLLVEIPGAAWMAVTEANLTDYAGMYLARRSAQDAALISRLSPLPKEPRIAVRTTLPHDSPWRVVMIAERVEKLIESDLVLNLNAPCAIADVSWIKPGKTAFPWWNGFYEEKLPFKVDINTATTKYYIDFCAQAGLPYHSLDGQSNLAWYGGPTVPYSGADITKGVDGLDLPEVLRYAKDKGIRLRLWMHWQAARDHMARAFPLYHQWGIEGVMIDFMDRDDQEMVGFIHDLLKTAAANQLTVNLHGASKPTGLERTYPNLLNSEAVLNLEYDKWDKLGVSPEHDTTVPFTRMLAGPLDFHQGSFRTVAVADFKPRFEAPLIMGTPCRTLATYVVFQNHLPMVADYPSAYRGHPGLPVLASIPCTWDDTRALAGAVGEYVVIARCSGSDWWVGAMTNREPRELQIPLAFLGSGHFRAEIYRDDAAAKYGLASETRSLAATDTLQARLAAAGGMVVRLTPQATP